MIDTLKTNQEYTEVILADQTAHPPDRRAAKSAEPVPEPVPEVDVAEQEPPQKRTRSQVSGKTPAGNGRGKNGKRPAIKRFQHGSEEVEGKLPRPTKRLLGRGIAQAATYNMSDFNQVEKLNMYLSDNGGWELFHTPKNGQCFFSSVRKGIEFPEEYRNDHLRFQIVHWCITNHGFAFTILKSLIQTEYGQKKLSRDEYLRKLHSQDDPLTEAEEEAYNKAGPFSFCDYLTYMIQSDSWADQGIITVLSMMWQLSITILEAERLIPTRIRHTKSIEDVDLLLVYAGQSHYLGTCKYPFSAFPFYF